MSVSRLMVWSGRNFILRQFLGVYDLVGGRYHVGHTCTLRETTSKTRVGVDTSNDTGKSVKSPVGNDRKVFRFITLDLS